MMRRMAAVAAAIGLLSILQGCASTADKSARLAAQNADVVAEKDVQVGKASAGVRVLGATTVTDPNGTAVVVRLRNTGASTLARVPIAIDVRDAAGASVFRNDTPGTEPALLSVAGLPAGRDVTWVHDQVISEGGPPARATARVGAAATVLRGPLPELKLGRFEVTSDPATGAQGHGSVTNDSQTAQRRLAIYAVARRGAKVVAAGRAVVERVAPGASARFDIFFIGKPAGATVTLTAPPSVTG